MSNLEMAGVAVSDSNPVPMKNMGSGAATPVDGTTGASPLTDTTSTAIIAAAAAGVRTYLTEITITNGHATVDTRVQILDGSTVRREIFCKASGGGAVVTFPTPLRGTAATAWNAKAVTTGSSIDVNMSGYQGA